MNRNKSRQNPTRVSEFLNEAMIVANIGCIAAKTHTIRASSKGILMQMRRVTNLRPNVMVARPLKGCQSQCQPDRPFSRHPISAGWYSDQEESLEVKSIDRTRVVARDQSPSPSVRRRTFGSAGQRHSSTFSAVAETEYYDARARTQDYYTDTAFGSVGTSFDNPI